MSEITAFEDAVATWVIGSCGLPSSKVVWDYWKQPRPATPFVEMSVSSDEGIGEAWLGYVANPSPSSGAERLVVASSHRQVTVTLQVFGETDAGNTPMAVMRRIAASLDLFVPQLDDLGVGVGDAGSVDFVAGHKGGVLEPRARWQVTMHVGAQAQRALSSFTSVDVTASVDATPPVSQTITVTAPT